MITQQLSASSLISLSEGQVSCDLVGEQVILQLQSGTYYGLQSVGYRIWQLLQQPLTFAAICNAVIGEYDVTPEQCQTEVADFLQELSAAGLVRIGRETPADSGVIVGS